MSDRRSRSEQGISRRAAPAYGSSGRSPESDGAGAGRIRADVDPAPKPWPMAQYLAFVAIFSFSLLQFLPATHFRDPFDRTASWVPFDSTASFTNSENYVEEEPTLPEHQSKLPEAIHIFSWMDCLNLRMAAVLMNSTLTNARCPERIQFHFFAPDGDNNKISYYKLKVLFPHTDLEIVGHEAVEEKLKPAASMGLYPLPPLHEIVPFVIPSLYPSLGRYVYLSADIIVEGRIDELFEVDLSNYGIAAADDCGTNLSEYVNFDVVDAIQRTGAQPWLSRKAYDKDACGVDLNVLLVDAKMLDRDILDAILWWSKVLNKKNERTPMNPANVLALYEKYVKLPHSWKTGDLEDIKTNNETNVLHFRVATTSCSGHGHEGRLGSAILARYLPSSSDRILGD